MCAFRDGVGGQAGRQRGLRASSDFKGTAKLRVRSVSQMLHRRTDQLETQHRQDKEDAENFTRTALRQPAFKPGEDHLHEH